MICKKMLIRRHGDRDENRKPSTVCSWKHFFPVKFGEHDYNMQLFDLERKKKKLTVGKFNRAIKYKRKPVFFCWKTLFLKW